MILTYKIKHEKDFSRELSLAKKVAEYGLQHKSISSKDVKHIGLKSAISNHIHHKYKHMRKSLQKQGKLKRVKAIKNRESRIVRDINHKTTTALMEFAKENNACIVMEDLKEIRRTAKTRRKQRYSLHSWSFYQQKMMIEYKAKKYGVSVHYVAPQYTSQRCSICGHIEQANRKGNLFCCKKCGTVEDSGVNAGFNIAYLHREGISQFNIERDMLKGNTDTPKEATL